MSFIGSLRFRLLDWVRGLHVVALLKHLKRAQFLPSDTLAAQMEARKEAYFRELKAHNALLGVAEAFGDLPVIDKAFATAHAGALANPHYKGKVFRKKTGGSLGTPFVYFTGDEAQSYLWAGILLSWSVAGYQLGERVAFLAGSSIFGSNSLKLRIYYRLMNVDLMSAFDMTDATMRAYLATLVSRRTRLLYGYASAIHRLAQFVIQHKEALGPHSLRGIFCTAEMLTPVMRQDIEAAFGVRCFSQYGCNDAGVSAFECERRDGFHLIGTRCYPELLDDGRFVATDVANTAFFLPRYDTGDRIRWANRACECGRGFPLIQEVLGRSNDIVAGPNGVTVHSEYFTHMFREDSRIAAFQVLFDHSTLVVLIKPSQTGVHDWSRYAMLVRDKLGFGLPEFIERDDLIALENGKHRFVMRVESLQAALK